MGFRHNFEKFDNCTKVQTVSYVKMRIETNKNWAKKALIKLYSFQTKNEKRNHITFTKDNFGFTKFDAPYFSNLACKVIQGKILSESEEKSLIKLSKYE